MGNIVQNYLAMAVDYGRSGFWEDAAETLSRLIKSRRENVTTYPLLYYYLGYFLEKSGDSQGALQYYRQAGNLSPYYCFPFRLESIDVLRAALKRNPSDARAHYYLGNLLFPLQPEEAIKEWEKAAKIDEALFLVHRNLGLAYAWIKNDLTKAIKCMERALFYNKSEPRLFYELDLLYEAGGVSPRKRLDLLEKYQSIIEQRDDSLSREILLLVQLGDYDKAINLLESHHFHVWEGGGRIHELYVDAHLLRGLEYFQKKEFERALQDYQKALEYPENLEVGRPYHDRRAFQIYYFIGTAYEALGKSRQAREFFQSAVQEKQIGSEVSYYQGLAYKKLGRVEDANQMFDELIAYSQQLLKKTKGLDFFAKFGERQSEAKRRAQAHYLLGLGYLGKGRKREAQAEFEKAIRLNPNHFKARKQFLRHIQRD
jgi:tetratricopeptide (TPR) repeat protein